MDSVGHNKCVTIGLEQIVSCATLRLKFSFARVHLNMHYWIKEDSCPIGAATEIQILLVDIIGAVFIVLEAVLLGEILEISKYILIYK